MSGPAKERRGKPWELLMAARLLRSKRSSQLSLISVMSVSGIALGVAALIVVLAVNTGFQTAFQERILATYPHVVAMRRGLDMNDWRDVTERLGALDQVHTAAPATYDDMMLASTHGRAGAIVRGVPATNLSGLPEGLVVAGRVDTHGESPTVVLNDDRPTRLKITGVTAGARHVLIAGAGASDTASVRPISVMTPQRGLSGLVIFDADGCRPATGAANRGAVHLLQAESTEVVRRIGRHACRVLTTWETLSGKYDVQWHSGSGKHEASVALHTGKTTVAILEGDQLIEVKPPDNAAPQTVAAISVVQLGASPLSVVFPGGQTYQLQPGDASPWKNLEGKLPAIALGAGLAKRLSVAVGQEVRAVSPMRDADGSRGSRTAGRFRVTAILSTGFHDHDQRLAMVDFGAAQRFLGRGDVARWVDARLDDPILAKAFLPKIRAALEPVTLADVMKDVAAARKKLSRVRGEIVPGLEVRAPRGAVDLVDNWISGVRAMRQSKTRGESMFRVLDWEEMNRNIFDAARLQKVAMSLFPFIIVLVAALNVIGTQAVVVHERARDIAILRAMGATGRSVGAVFLTQGLAVGLLGTAIGLILGGLCCLALAKIGYPLDPNVYLIDELPVQIEATTFAMAGGAATALSFGAAWVSARRAATRSPVDGLRRLD
ncbi:MAG: ABC transporter permease [Myxococcales bacterium]|nr:ABC transporter permease [Myxococcales bacterium]